MLHMVAFSMILQALSFIIHHPDRTIGAAIIVYAVLATLIMVGKGEV